MIRAISFREGAFVRHTPTGQLYVIAAPHALSPEQVLGRHTQTGQLRVLKFEELELPEAAAVGASPPDLGTISEEDWAQQVEPRLRLICAVERAPQWRPIRSVIQPVLEELALEGKSVSLATAYRWLKQRREGTMTLRRARRRDCGARRLHPSAEAIIDHVIVEQLLQRQSDQVLPTGAERVLPKTRRSDPKQRTTIAQAIRHIHNMCIHAGVQQHQLPHPNTIRSRIDTQLGEHRARRARVKSGRDAERALQATSSGHHVSRPNEEWQADHTKLSVIVVHSTTRRPIGRAWITVIMDVRTRVIVAWYVTLEAPGTFSIGSALVDGILPKKRQIVTYNLTREWPVWGKPERLVVDNAKEFRGRTLLKFLQMHGIDIVWRPVGKPQFGAHIERVIGTIEGRVKSWHGATGSNHAERGDYDAEGNAIYDLRQLDRKIALEVEAYNHAHHSGINALPMEKYIDEVFTSPITSPGERFTESDAARMRIDVLPYTEVTVQRTGVRWDNVFYFHDVLRPLVKDGRKYVVRRDPRDISKLHLWHPEHNCYYELHYRDRSHPAISIWELEAARQALNDEKRPIDERQLMATVAAHRRIDEEALEQHRRANSRSKRAQRNNERQQRNTGELRALPTPGDGTAPPAPGERGVFTGIDLSTLDVLDDLLN